MARKNRDEPNEYTIQPTALRVCPGRVSDDPTVPMIGIQAVDSRARFTIPLCAEDALIMARSLWTFANDARVRGGLPPVTL